MKSTNPFAMWRWEDLFQNFDSFSSGFLRTLQVAILALVLSLVIGIVIGILSTAHNLILRSIARVYVEIFQNIPLVIQIFFMYNGLAMAGLVLRLG